MLSHCCCCCCCCLAFRPRRFSTQLGIMGERCILSASLQLQLLTAVEAQRLGTRRRAGVFLTPSNPLQAVRPLAQSLSTKVFNSRDVTKLSQTGLSCFFAPASEKSGIVQNHFVFPKGLQSVTDLKILLAYVRLFAKP